LRHAPSVSKLVFAFSTGVILIVAISLSTNGANPWLPVAAAIAIGTMTVILVVVDRTRPVVWRWDELHDEALIEPIETQHGAGRSALTEQIVVVALVGIALPIVCGVIAGFAIGRMGFPLLVSVTFASLSTLLVVALLLRARPTG
jgi:hypothetical protein